MFTASTWDTIGEFAAFAVIAALILIASHFRMPENGNGKKRIKTTYKTIK